MVAGQGGTPGHCGQGPGVDGYGSRLQVRRSTRQIKFDTAREPKVAQVTWPWEGEKPWPKKKKDVRPSNGTREPEKRPAVSFLAIRYLQRVAGTGVCHKTQAP